MRMLGVMMVLVACSVDNRDDDPFGSATGATAASTMSSSASDTEEATGQGSEGSSGEGSSGAGSSSGGPAESSGEGSTSDGSTTMPETAATMTTMNPTTTMGGNVCDEFCNGCSCPSDECTMCCALNDQVDQCQGGLCFCFG